MSTLKSILIFTLGAGVGTTVTYFVLRKKFNEEFEAAAEEVKKDYEKHIGSLNGQIDILNATINEKDTTIKSLVDASSEAAKLEEKKRIALEEKPEPEDILKEKVTKNAAVDYTKFSSKNDKVEEENKDIKTEEVLEKAKTPAKGKCKAPYVIKGKEYISGDLDKVILRYFSNDDIFLTEEGEIATGIKTKIGKNNINFLVNESDGEIFVRNESVGVDYDIVLDETPYEDYIENGVYEDPDEEN